MSFPRYPKTKPSGVEWLGDVPEHWEVWKLSHAFSLIGSGTTPKSDNAEYYDSGDIPWVNTGDLNDSELEGCGKSITELALAHHSSLKVYPAGSLLIAMYGATIGKLGILQFSATVNQACCVFGGTSVITSKFMFYWFLGLRQQILSLATGGGQPNVSQDILRGIRAACPDPSEQSAIASFLDHETGKIDVLVEEQRWLIALLKEKRQAVISHAVTKGLNPQAPMKPSGVESLGDVPAHWEVGKLSRLTNKIGDGLHGTPDYVDESKFRFINGNNLVDGSISLVDTTRCVSEAEFRKHSVQLDKTTVLLSINGTIGNFALYNGESVMLGKSASYINCGERLSREYFGWYLQSSFIRLYFDYSVTGTTIFNLSLESVRRMPVALPPLGEQAQIVANLVERAGYFDGLLHEAHRAIDLLQERRTALISAAVTGKIDVRSFTQNEAA